MALAVEEIRRMRGGAQSHLMRCADDSYYVVKFQNNPQGVRILVNELLGTRLAARLGLPVAGASVVEVRPELIARTDVYKRQALPKPARAEYPPIDVLCATAALPCQIGACTGQRPSSFSIHHEKNA